MNKITFLFVVKWVDLVILVSLQLGVIKPDFDSVSCQRCFDCDNKVPLHVPALDSDQRVKATMLQTANIIWLSSLLCTTWITKFFWIINVMQALFVMLTRLGKRIGEVVSLGIYLVVNGFICYPPFNGLQSLLGQFSLLWLINICNWFFSFPILFSVMT